VHKIGFVMAAAVLAVGCAAETEKERPPASSGAATTPGAYQVPDGATTVGEAITVPVPVQLAVVKRSPAEWFERTILVEATAADVCQARGCWLTLTDGPGEPIWARWASGCGGQYAFPKDVAGRRVVVQGSIYEKEIDPTAAAHLAAESGGLVAEEVAGKTLEMNVTACVILPAAAGKSEAS
jgi:hypothetical protein